MSEETEVINTKEEEIINKIEEDIENNSENIELPDGFLVDQVLDKIRPYIQRDGGDIELLGIDETGTVYVQFRGACQGCMMAAADFTEGIRDIIMDEVPNVRDVFLVG